jgi:alkylhydroperoxidase family enzyme
MAAGLFEPASCHPRRSGAPPAEHRSGFVSQNLQSQMCARSLLPITPQERVMVDYVVKLTKDATKAWKDDIEELRAAGFDDRGILQITLIASWFNYINRVADGLGVGRK